MTALILKSNAWHLIEELPEEPNYCIGFIAEDRYCVLCSSGRGGCEDEKVKYTRALQLAISNAIMVENQDVAVKILQDKFISKIPDEENVYPIYIVDIRYKKKEVPDEDSGRDNFYNKVDFHWVARLISSKEETMTYTLNVKKL